MDFGRNNLLFSCFTSLPVLNGREYPLFIVHCRYEEKLQDSSFGMLNDTKPLTDILNLDNSDLVRDPSVNTLSTGSCFYQSAAHTI